MADPIDFRKEIMERVLNRKKLGGKKFHSETSLQKFGEEVNDTNDVIKCTNAPAVIKCINSPATISTENEDPGVLNTSLNGTSSTEITRMARKRAVSQPGPGAGSALVTAGAARAARRRPQRNVAYASDLVRSESDTISREVTQQKTDESGTATPPGNASVSSLGDKGSPFSAPLYNSNYRNGDAKSLNSYRFYAPSSERNSGTPWKRSAMTMDAQSIRSVETQAPPPTDPRDNKRQTKAPATHRCGDKSLVGVLVGGAVTVLWCNSLKLNSGNLLDSRKYITLVMSTIYAVMLVTLGLIIHIADIFVTKSTSMSAVYSIILSVMGLSYLIYLMIDIGRYKKTVQKNQEIKEQYEDRLAEYFRNNEENFIMEGSEDGTPYKPPTMTPPVFISTKHNYCFSQGRHSGSFYLKIGAAGFALGSLVHSVLLIAVQLSFLFDDNISNEECIDYVKVALDMFYPFYCFVQLFFIFKYSNVIVLRAQGVARFAFMHMIGSSLCFWVSVIVRETILALTLYAQLCKNAGHDTSNEDSSIEDSSFENNALEERQELRKGQLFFNVSNLYDEKCVGTAQLNKIFESYSPYLYPFSVEFNILIVAVYYIIWKNIGHCTNEDSSNSDNASVGDDDTLYLCKIPTASEQNDFTSNLVIYADCHASNRGLFLGLIVMVLITGSLILGFVISNIGGDLLYTGYLLKDATKLSLHSIMLFASILAFTQTIKLDINHHSISLLDDILLFICLPPFFMETVLSLAATLTIVNVIKSVDFTVMIIQVMVQTPLIMDGLRRCSNSRKLRRTKPGREIIMFLIITNVAMWLFYTFSYKSPQSLDERYSYYGKELWTILGHVSLPLIMFYRFHSSVCFADIWGSAYTPGSEH